MSETKADPPQGTAAPPPSESESTGAGAGSTSATPARESVGHAHEAPPASPEVIQRRRFLARVSVGLGAVAGAALGVPMVGFVVAPVLRPVPRLWRAVGKVADYKVGETVGVAFVDTSPLPWAGVTANTGAWLRRLSDNAFQAFSINCAHLGCPVRWLPDARLFMCPCHGGVYYEDGSVAAGPPPHPLPQYLVRISGENVEIRADPLPIG
jgi:menaquinol-cytochrome c reductase iron-sulfur subunit